MYVIADYRRQPLNGPAPACAIQPLNPLVTLLQPRFARTKFEVFHSDLGIYAQNMPRKPSKAKMIQYDVEGVITRKLHLGHIYDKECAILGANPEETTRVHAELQRDNTYYEGGVPRDSEQAKVFLETCNTLVQSPATDTARCVILHLNSSFILTLPPCLGESRGPVPL